ncbi:MAG: Gfo/Idh/MocA family oxidoreductase, partial [Pirellulaceae bacterium]
IEGETAVSENLIHSLTRRELLVNTGRVAAVTALAGVAIPHVHAAQNETIQVALIGSGGRGTGAAREALSSKNGPTKLVAMADVFETNLSNSYNAINAQHTDRVDVPPDRRYVGFDGYKKAMDCLNPGDIVILATPPAFRWVHFTYAIEKGLNVFMEKPIAVDAPSARRMLELGKKSVEKNLKVGVGLMCRHCPARNELHDRIQNGEIGDVLLLRAYRVSGPTGSAFVGPNRSKNSELLYQIRNFHAFLWLSGGGFSDFLIHNIDECCWMKDAWPVFAKGYGGRHYRGDDVDQNFDSYTTEYTFADGTKLMLEGRGMSGCDNEFASYVHGSKGSAVISRTGHWPSKAQMFKGQDMSRSNLIWDCGDEPREDNPYQVEWDHLLAAVKQGKPHNEVERGAKASLVTAMGRFACHTGSVITYDGMLEHTHEFAPNVDTLTMEGAAPLQADKDGKYPVPQPGLNTNREYS